MCCKHGSEVRILNSMNINNLSYPINQRFTISAGAGAMGPSLIILCQREMESSRRVLEEEFFPLLILCRKWLLKKMLAHRVSWGLGEQASCWGGRRPGLHTPCWRGSVDPKRVSNLLGWVSLGTSFRAVILCACMPSDFSRVWLFVTPWTVARQAPLSMRFSRQEHWSGVPCPPPTFPRIFLTPGSNLHLLVSLPLVPLGKPSSDTNHPQIHPPPLR